MTTGAQVGPAVLRGTHQPSPYDHLAVRAFMLQGGARLEEIRSTFDPQKVAEMAHMGAMSLQEHFFWGRKRSVNLIMWFRLS